MSSSRWPPDTGAVCTPTNIQFHCRVGSEGRLLQKNFDTFITTDCDLIFVLVSQGDTRDDLVHMVRLQRLPPQIVTAITNCLLPPSASGHSQAKWPVRSHLNKWCSDLVQNGYQTPELWRSTRQIRSSWICLWHPTAWQLSSVRRLLDLTQTRWHLYEGRKNTHYTYKMSSFAI